MLNLKWIAALAACLSGQALAVPTATFPMHKRASNSVSPS